jgi:hypothetical protein
MSTTTPEGEPTEPTRWHPCSVCPSHEGSYYLFPFICCSDCAPGLEEALARAYEDYRAHRKKDDRA